MVLFALELRRYLVVRLFERGGDATVAELVADLEAEGFRVPGRTSRTVSDAFRAEVTRGRVVRVARGLSTVGHVPRTTKHRMVHEVAGLRAGRRRAA